MYENYFEKVEEVLDTFPEDCRINYYENKKKLKIEHPDKIFKRIFAYYDNETNEIQIHNNDEAIPHELFHMACRDPKKVGKKIFDEHNWTYSNGIAIKREYKGEIIVKGKGITEGFVEYLSRKCDDLKGHQDLFYFVDLLISIYGEELIHYVLKNDPIGFIDDGRFNDIWHFYEELDNLDEISDGIGIIHDYKESINVIFNSDDGNKKQKLFDIIRNVRFGFKKSIIELFKIIIDEYNNCNNPKISKEEFTQKLISFVKDPNREHYFLLDDDEISMLKEINILIEEFSKGKKKR